MADNEHQEDPIAGWFEEHSHAVGNAKISHALLAAAKSEAEAFARATLPDENKLLGLNFFRAKLKLYGLGISAPPPLNAVAEIIMYYLIGSNAVGGQSRFMAMEADIGAIDQAAHQTFLTGKSPTYPLKTKKSMGIFKKKEQADQQE